MGERGESATVSSSASSRLRWRGAAVQVATTNAEFVQRVRALLDGAPHDPAPGLAAAAAASWELSVPELAAWVSQSPASSRIPAALRT